MKIRWTNAFLIILIVATLSFGNSDESPKMYAHFINVGQADTALLEFPCGAILIDAGVQNNEYRDKLMRYLTKFFEKRRPDLQKTLKAIYVTHNHSDHTSALKKICETFTVERYIDNAQNEGSSSSNPTNWIRQVAESKNIEVLGILDSDVTEGDNETGLTNDTIDPLECDDCDPQIRILSGRFTENPGWLHEEFDNKNNHSLVIRVDFGESSFLFTGDLQEPAINTFISYYPEDPQAGSNNPNDILNVDIYQVGHHGSHNATTSELLQRMTPDIAVISAGKWDQGEKAWKYGHPRKNIVDMLSVSIKKKRSKPANIKVAESAKNYVDYTVKKKIYATPWDGNIRIKATLEEKFRVQRNVKFSN